MSAATTATIRTRTDSGNLAPSVNGARIGQCCADTARQISSGSARPRGLMKAQSSWTWSVLHPSARMPSDVLEALEQQLLHTEKRDRKEIAALSNPLTRAHNSRVPEQRFARAGRSEGGPMAVDVKQPRSRRALLAGLAGAAGAVAASAVARPGPARAGVDGDVVLGAANAETATTSISNSSSGVAAIEASAATTGVGVAGNSAAGSGVHAHSGPTAPAPAPPADPIGVFGEAEADLGTGVWGRGAVTATSNSTGVFGEGDFGVIGAAIRRHSTRKRGP